MGDCDSNECIRNGEIIMKYSEQLKDPRWKEKARKIRARDGHKCTVCDSTQKLNVHHKRYVKGGMAWDVKDSDLITLCKNCHSKFHGHSHEDKSVDRKNRRIERLRQSRERRTVRTEESIFESSKTAEYIILSAELQLRGLSEGSKDGQFKAISNGITVKWKGSTYSYFYNANMAQHRTSDSFRYEYMAVDKFVEWIKELN